MSFDTAGSAVKARSTMKQCFGWRKLLFELLLELGAAFAFLVLPLATFVPPIPDASSLHARSPKPLVSGFRVLRSPSTHPQEQLPREEVSVYGRTSPNAVGNVSKEVLVQPDVEV